MENTSIRFWAEDDRPREKMMIKGRLALSNSELLAILIGSGTRKKSAVELAQEILSASKNNLRTLSKVSQIDLCKFDGIGEAKAITILAAMELARRRDQEPSDEKVKIKSSYDAYNVLKSMMQDLYQEVFYALFLNQANQIIKIEFISKGGINSTVVDQRVIFKEALACGAVGIILAHNHPSGNLNPSENDIKITDNIRSTGKILEIQLLDHLIITDHGYFSFADNGT